MSPFFIVSLVMFLIWLGFILFSSKTRREQIIMSFVGLIVAPGALMIASADYRGQGTQIAAIGIEDLLFSFALFGIAAVIYQVLLGKRISNRTIERRRVQPAILHWAAQLVIMISAWLLILLVMNAFFGMGVIQSAVIGGLFVGIYIIADRKDLLADALLSGFFTLVLVFVTEQLFFVRLFPEAISNFWTSETVSGIVLGGIPFEELLWAAVVGFAIGPLYEYIRRYQLR